MEYSNTYIRVKYWRRWIGLFLYSFTLARSWSSMRIFTMYRNIYLSWRMFYGNHFGVSQYSIFRLRGCTVIDVSCTMSLTGSVIPFWNLSTTAKSTLRYSGHPLHWNISLCNINRGPTALSIQHCLWGGWQEEEKGGGGTWRFLFLTPFHKCYLVEEL